LPATSGTAQNGALRVQGANGNSVLDIGADSFSSGSGWLQSTNRTNLSLTYPLLLNPRGGNLGIGIATTPGPELRTHILGTSGLPVTSGTAQNGALRIQGASGNSVLDIGADSSSTGNEWLQSTNRTNLGLTYPLLLNPRGGNVGIGTVTPTAKLDVNGDLNVTGNAVVSGNIAAKYQDVAEWVQARQLLAAGTVVSLDGTLTNAVAASRRAYDTHVAGVVSTQPGVILGEGGPGRVLVSTTGRLRVKVDASRYPIRIGDLLVSSNKPGVAMRSKPIRIGGKLIHRPGTIIGKALEALPNGSGEILVLVSLQ
jgi:hypothetical protein